MIYADDLARDFTVDGVRYYALAETPYATDGSITYELMISRYNTELVNNLGNLFKRTLDMHDKYFGGTLPSPRETDDADLELVGMAGQLRSVYEQAMDTYAPQTALVEVLKVISRANKYIDETAPWILARDEGKKARLAAVLYNLLETVRLCSVLLSPFMPDSCEKIRTQIGALPEQFTWETAGFGVFGEQITVNKGDIIFPRIDLKKELEALASAQEG